MLQERFTMSRRRPAGCAPRNGRRGRRGRRTRRGLLRALCGLFLAAPAAGTFAQAPAHLDILSAVIREEPPLDAASIPPRTVVVELVLAGAPVCDPSTPFLAYGVLIDSDQDPLTGVTDPAYDALGVDARISADCDGGTGVFSSNAGAVSLTGDPGGTATVTITLTVADLPRVQFDWLAFAQEGGDLTRLPAAPEYATWTILERSLP